MTWSGRRVLVTGHTGFKGSWLTHVLLREGATVVGGSLPSSIFEPSGTYRALRSGWDLDEREVDVTEPEGVNALIAAGPFDAVFHLAAQALVLEGYRRPSSTFAVNVVGTTASRTLVVRRAAAKVVIVVTSDKVYANDGSGTAFSEEHPLGGSDPYSASKAAAELAVRCWRSSFRGDTTVVSARAGNVIGGGDRGGDRLLPDVFRAVRSGDPLVVRRPGATRPWQHVFDVVRGYLDYAEFCLDGRDAPEALNFGPPPTQVMAVADVLQRLDRRWEGLPWRHEPPPEGADEAALLSIDPSRAGSVLGWSAQVGIDDALGLVHAWDEAELAGHDLRPMAELHLRDHLDPWRP